MFFNREYDLHCALQEAYENERIIPSLSYNSIDIVHLASISGGNTLSLSSVSGPPSTSSVRNSTDPPRLSTFDKKRPVANLQEIIYPSGHRILCDWKPEVTTQTDSNGWQYADDFFSSTWSECAINPEENHVRHRKWQRLTIPSNDYSRGCQYLAQFQPNLTLFRSLSPNIIQYIFENEPYHIQMILEFQRSLNGEYSSDYLLPSDPAQWSSGFGDYALMNPKLLQIDQLKEVVGTIYNGGDGWETLHDFIYQIASDTDSQGWQYNTSFISELEWRKTSKSESCMMNVRRRLWFRTCVPDSYLESSQDKLLSYFAKRPRGVIKCGNLQRQGQFKVMWYDSYATLTDSQLEIILLKYESPFKNSNSPGLEDDSSSSDEWYLGKKLGLKKPIRSIFSTSTSINAPAPKQLTFLGGGVVKYPLHGCEVIELSEPEEEQRTEISPEETPKKLYQFALRTGKSWGKYHFTSNESDEPDSICSYTVQEDYHLLCVLNAYTQQDYHDWICALRNQIALVNLHFWPFPGSPPILDQVLIEGYMWIKSGQIIKKWKYRKFELRQNGILVYLKGNIVIGKIRLRLCYIEDCNDSDLNMTPEITCSPLLKVLRSDSVEQNSNQEHYFLIRNDYEGFEIQLKTSNFIDKMQWMKALKDHSNIEKILRCEGKLDDLFD